MEQSQNLFLSTFFPLFQEKVSMLKESVKTSAAINYIKLQIYKK